MSTISLNDISNKVLLDSICNYLLISNINEQWYPADRKIFTNKLMDSLTLGGCGMNIGCTSIDTLNLSIRFHYTGMTGSGGFAPFIQKTFFFRDFVNMKWKDGNNENEKILNILSEYNELFGNHKYVVLFEQMNGAVGSEDRILNYPEYSLKYYSDYNVVFQTITNKDITILNNLLNRMIYKCRFKNITEANKK